MNDVITAFKSKDLGSSFEISLSCNSLVVWKFRSSLTSEFANL
jgi:hypothetical protein